MRFRHLCFVLFYVFSLPLVLASLEKGSNETKKKQKKNLHPLKTLHHIETTRWIKSQCSKKKKFKKEKSWAFVLVCHFVYNNICQSSFLLCSSQIYHHFSFVVSTKNTIVAMYIYLFCFVLCFFLRIFLIVYVWSCKDFFDSSLFCMKYSAIPMGYSIRLERRNFEIARKHGEVKRVKIFAVTNWFYCQ